MELVLDSMYMRYFRRNSRSFSRRLRGMPMRNSLRARSISSRIFLTVTERFGIAPEETLFLDDSQSNVEAASKLGFGTLHVPLILAVSRYKCVFAFVESVEEA